MQVSNGRVLVIGSGGAQGSGLVRAVLERGAVPIRLTSNAERAEAFRSDGHDAVVADLTDARAVRHAAEKAGVTAVAGIIPLQFGSPGRSGPVVASYLALRELGVSVAVNVGSPLPAAEEPDVAGSGTLARALADAGIAVVAPTGYLENHAAPWALATLLDGDLVYPRPANDVIAWVAAQDLSAAALAAIDNDLAGEVLRLAGPEPLTFTRLASELGAGIGRDVTFRSVTATQYGNLLRPYTGDDAAAGVEQMYGSAPPTPLPAMNPAEAASNWNRLGLRPTPARQWAEEVLRPLLR